MRRSWMVAALLLLSGCSSQMASDLRAAERPCDDQDFPTKTQLVSCLNTNERTVWAREEPSTLDLYDDFAARRATLAQQRDSGQIDSGQYDQQLDQLVTEFKGRMAARRKATAATAEGTTQPPAPLPPAAPAPPQQ